MPFDPMPVEHDVFSLDGLISWLETMPADATYCYVDTGQCLIAQFFTAIGVPFDEIGGFTWLDHTGGVHNLPNWLGDIPVLRPRTFGAALQRAKSLRG